MGSYEYMCRLLQPLRLYDLEFGAGAEELRVVGGMLDELAAELDKTEREASVLSAEADGLAAIEQLLPYVPVSATPEARREALAALLRIDGRSFTPEALQSTLSGCGIAASVREGEAHYSVEVSFPDTMGEPENFAAVKSRIEQILPCHLEVIYLLRWLLWSELDTLPNWSALEERATNWSELEKLRLN